MFDNIKQQIMKRKNVKMNTLMIAINAIVFILVEITGSSLDTVHMIKWGAAYSPLMEVGHEYYRLFTCMFLHFGISHLINNMIVLAFLGDTLERAVGSVKYLIIYVVGGLGASYISFYTEIVSNKNTVSAGASGAVFAVIGAMLYILLVNKGRIEDLTTGRLILMIVLTLYLGITSTGVDNMAHLGGLFCGFLLGVLLYKKRRNGGY